MEYVEKKVQVPKELDEFLAALGGIAEAAMAAYKDDGKISFTDAVSLMPKVYEATRQFEGVMGELSDVEAASVAGGIWLAELIGKLRA